MNGRALTIFLGVFLGGALLSAAPHVETVPGEYIVRYKARPSAQALRSFHASIKTTHFSEKLNLVKISGEQPAQLEQTLASLRSDSDVLYIEPNYIYRQSVVPNDPRLIDQYALTKTQAFDAWNQTVGDSNVIVAVIDTGVDYRHPDIIKNIWVNTGEVAENGLDDDRNGYVDDYRGYDFSADDFDPYDEESHGTHVAGIIGATANNRLGIAGVAWNVRIMPVRFLDKFGYGDSIDAVRAIEYAVRNKAQVINASWGGFGNSRALQDAVDEAHAAGTVFVAAAGNDEIDFPYYPASLNHVISVGATDNNDKPADFSNYGAPVDLAAPGKDILSLIPGNRFATNSGTSMAAPFVSGVAALVLSLNPTAAPNMETLLKNSCDPLPTGSGRFLGAGRINVLKAVQSQQVHLLADLTINDPVYNKNGGVPVWGETGGDDFKNYLIEYGPTLEGPWEPYYFGTSKVPRGEILGTINLSGKPNGKAYLKLTVTATNGQTKQAYALIALVTDKTQAEHLIARSVDANIGLFLDSVSNIVKSRYLDTGGVFGQRDLSGAGTEKVFAYRPLHSGNLVAIQHGARNGDYTYLSLVDTYTANILDALGQTESWQNFSFLEALDDQLLVRFSPADFFTTARTPVEERIFIVDARFKRRVGVSPDGNFNFYKSRDYSNYVEPNKYVYGEFVSVGRFGARGRVSEYPREGPYYPTVLRLTHLFSSPQNKFFASIARNMAYAPNPYIYADVRLFSFDGRRLYDAEADLRFKILVDPASVVLTDSEFSFAYYQIIFGPNGAEGQGPRQTKTVSLVNLGARNETLLVQGTTRALFKRDRSVPNDIDGDDVLIVKERSSGRVIAEYQLAVDINVSHNILRTELTPDEKFALIVHYPVDASSRSYIAIVRLEDGKLIRTIGDSFPMAHPSIQTLQNDRVEVKYDETIYKDLGFEEREVRHTFLFSPTYGKVELEKSNPSRKVISDIRWSVVEKNYTRVFSVIHGAGENVYSHIERKLPLNQFELYPIEGVRWNVGQTHFHVLSSADVFNKESVAPFRSHRLVILDDQAKVVVDVRNRIGSDFSLSSTAITVERNSVQLKYRPILFDGENHTLGNEVTRTFVFLPSLPELAAAPWLQRQIEHIQLRPNTPLFLEAPEGEFAGGLYHTFYRHGAAPYAEYNSGTGITVDLSGGPQTFEWYTDFCFDPSCLNKFGHLEANGTPNQIIVSAALGEMKLTGFPSPFSPKEAGGQNHITLQYPLGADADVEIEIYDLTGRLVWQRAIPAGAEGGLAKNDNQVQWDGRNGDGNMVGNGGYIVSVKGGGQHMKTKILVAK